MMRNMLTIVTNLDSRVKSLDSRVKNLEKESQITNKKIDGVQEDTRLIPEMHSMLAAAGQNIETLSARVDKMESNN